MCREAEMFPPAFVGIGCEGGVDVVMHGALSSLVSSALIRITLPVCTVAKQVLRHGQYLLSLAC